MSYSIMVLVDFIDCNSDDICHLAWIVRDNRHFLNFTTAPICSNGTELELLNLNEFEKCDMQFPGSQD